jgi:hypothetical protein
MPALQVASADLIPEELRSVRTRLDGSGTRYTHLVLPYKPELLGGQLTKQLWESFDVYTLVTLDRIWEVEVRRRGQAGRDADALDVQTYTREEHERLEAPSGYTRRLVALMSSGSEVKKMMVRQLPCSKLIWDRAASEYTD